MENVKNIVLTATTSLVISEIIYFLTPKDKLINCIYALIYTVTITFALVSIINIDWDVSLYSDYENEYQAEIDEAIYQFYKLETESEMKLLVEDALAVLNIPVSQVETIIDVGEEDITINSIKIILVYKEDIENAKIILYELFQNQVPMEVISEN